jgi:hypothetical protein
MRITNINSDDYTLFLNQKEAETYRDGYVMDYLQEGDTVFEGQEIFVLDAETNKINSTFVGEDKFFEAK